MTVESARRFLNAHPESIYKEHPKHKTYLRAWEIIEQFKREQIIIITKQKPVRYANN